jgi:hypothetical protein
MATLDYNRRLNNLQARRFDSALNESALTKSFSASDIPHDVKYLFESMKAIDDKYNSKTIQAAEHVRTHLERDLQLHFARAYRTQGSVITRTNIRVYSDFDLLTIINRYFYPQGTPAVPYTASDPDVDIQDLRDQATEIMQAHYKTVDVTGDKCISVENKHLNRKVDIVFAYWYNSDTYESTKDEYYRGIYLYNFPQKEKQKDFPFASLHNVNVKGDKTNDGSRKGIRLLKNLRADSEKELKSVKSFHLTSLVHAIDDNLLYYQTGNELKIARTVSGQLHRLIEDQTYRKSITSPNGLEKPFTSDNVVPDLVSLKADLDLLIEDASSDITKSYSLQRTILAY